MAQDEAQEYLAKLQQGKIQIPPDASALEHQIVQTMNEAGKRMRELTTAKGDMEREGERIKVTLANIEKQMSAVEGQIGAYAALLVTAEADRRNQAKVAEKGEKPAEDPTAKTSDETVEVPSAPVKASEGPPAKTEIPAVASIAKNNGKPPTVSPPA
jgi:predicted  nucleic acid-binding Zn-ribbon protein